MVMVLVVEDLVAVEELVGLRSSMGDMLVKEVGLDMVVESMVAGVVVEEGVMVVEEEVDMLVVGSMVLGMEVGVVREVVGVMVVV